MKMDKWYLQKYTYNLQILTIMKVGLGIKTASSVVAASGCPRTTEGTCGIMYRSY